jgi:hypothetical protein
VPHPFNSQSYNRYSYVYNNPIIYTDPSGHEICMEGTSSCFDPITKKLSGSLSGSGCTTCWSTEEDEEVIDEPTYGNGLIGPPAPPTYGNGLIGPPPPTYGNGLIGPPAPQNYESNFIELPDKYGANSEELFLFWEYFGAPIFLGIEIDEVYQASQRGGWKLVKWSIPSGPFEAVAHGLQQGYRDSWSSSLSSEQRVFRIATAATEAFIVDGASTLAGGAGFEVAGPVGYLAGSLLVSAAGEKIFHNTINPWLFPSFGLGNY